ncbi:uncharacterized protein LY89DRAFT_278174 [Mollisia scopiformis]|uniref:Secreted protein n=1 Tax=Mollisia scopiformis TaxID=149040 RepID=A0A132BC37_MOLSC|nr:uncharacterized protein LY89DRAFT_278174 [Mollisia scopiformis]KUJ09833.1 hypothetical protein LY89DRAFT_278174 [Mollisia scopiformis]
MGSHFALHCCSVVFMIMRFPLRVVAIGGVEAGSGKGGMACSGVFRVAVWSHFRRHHSVCVLLSFPSGVQYLKNSEERKLAGLRQKMQHRAVDCTIALQRALWGMELEYRGILTT